MHQNTSVYEHHPIQLGCFASGDPKPQVSWYKNGQRLITDSRISFDQHGYLSIDEVQITDSGEFLCKATNIAGTATHFFYLNVIGKPKFPFFPKKNTENSQISDEFGETISNDILTELVRRAKGDVNRQIEATLKHLYDRRRPKTSSDLLSLMRFPKPSTIDLVNGEEIYERALELVFKYASNMNHSTTSDSFKLDEIISHRQLQRIADLSGCHRHKRRVNCSARCLNYRTMDGTCNNLGNPHWGAANTPLRRLSPPEYENGFSTPRGWTKGLLHNNYELPSARLVSSRIISTKTITNDADFSHMLMQWGQFLDHDLSHTVQAASLNRFSNGIACKDSCTSEQPCFPIEIPQNDTKFAEHASHFAGNRVCIEFVRSSAVCGSAETGYLMQRVIQREQVNQLTSYIDASNVYGSSDQDAFDLRDRTSSGGKLKIHTNVNHPKGLLPFNLDAPMDCQRDNTSQVGCFFAGDYRANEQLGLLAMHNLWVRQHNRLADGLREVNRHWSGEQIYQEARKIVGAQMQHITFAQWLPYILGPVGMRLLGEYSGYDETVDVSVTNEFATAAFR